MDIDHVRSELNLLSIFYNMRYHGMKTPESINEKYPTVRRSSSGRGFHFIIRGLKISYEESLFWREFYGDDPQRLKFDREKNMKPKQILFYMKDGERIQPLMEKDFYKLPFWVPRGVVKYWRKKKKSGRQFSN